MRREREEKVKLRLELKCIATCIEMRCISVQVAMHFITKRNGMEITTNSGFAFYGCGVSVTSYADSAVCVCRSSIRSLRLPPQR